MYDHGVVNYMFKDLWNFNNVTMLPVAWVYCHIRIFSENYSKPYLLVRGFYNDENHRETELLVDMLKNKDDSNYLKED